MDGGENSFTTYLYRDSSNSILKYQTNRLQNPLFPLKLLSLLPESPFELLLWRAGRGDVDGQQELLEVNVAVLVGVERAEHVVTELFRVAAGEEQLVHVDKLGRGQTAVGTILLEALVPLLDRVLVVAGVGLEELEVLLAEARLALYAPHDGLFLGTAAASKQQSVNKDNLPPDKNSFHNRKVHLGAGWDLRISMAR